MNSERLLKVADYMENKRIPGLGYDQSAYMYNNECGTLGCIAGWTYCVIRRVKHVAKLGTDGHTMREVAQKYLGLDDDEANDLFDAYPLTNKRPIMSDAIATLRKAAVTGKIEWVHA